MNDEPEHDELSLLREQVAKYRRRKDEAYEERNRVISLLLRMALALGWRAGVGTHEDKPGESWDPEWRTIVCVDTPAGQASWHLHESQAHLVADLPRYPGAWDGHTTAEKYRRLESIREVRAANRDGKIDRSSPDEAQPFMDRVTTPDGLAIELARFAQLVGERGFFPAGSDVETRFQLLMGLATGTAMRRRQSKAPKGKSA